jgi:hypothetical protein
MFSGISSSTKSMFGSEDHGYLNTKPMQRIDEMDVTYPAAVVYYASD